MVLMSESKLLASVPSVWSEDLEDATLTSLTLEEAPFCCCFAELTQQK